MAIMLSGCSRDTSHPPPTSFDGLVTWNGSPAYVDAGYYDLWIDDPRDSRQFLMMGMSATQFPNVQTPIISVSEDGSHVIVTVADTNDTQVTIWLSAEEGGEISAVGLARDHPNGSRTGAIDRDLDGVFDVHDTTSQREE